MPRGNPQYLIVPTSEQARKNGAKGGRASQKSQRMKKTMEKVAKAILDMKAEIPEELKNKLCSVFPEIDGDDLSARMIALLALYGRLLTGDPRAFEVFRDTAGEAPPKQLDVNANVTGIDICFLDSGVDTDDNTDNNIEKNE